ncbi:MAG: SAM-dependent methyltransferase [Eubacteriaceae bacterium]|jgi:tRNA-Thr(GGU) m(6)t(6)A37 methyltransferase TsaA|nr:SAM-dependent methyltransferase [Eubacteriaceae bacterium]
MGNSKEIMVKPIGYIETDYKTVEDLNIPPFKEESPYHNADITGTIHMHDEYVAGIKDIQPGSSAMLVFYFNQSEDYQLVAPSPISEKPIGVFSTRSPHRPNGIGVTIVHIIQIFDNKITFQGVDMLDGTPLLDIKPNDRAKK